MMSAACFATVPRIENVFANAVAIDEHTFLVVRVRLQLLDHTNLEAAIAARVLLLLLIGGAGTVNMPRISWWNADHSLKHGCDRQLLVPPLAVVICDKLRDPH